MGHGRGATFRSRFSRLSGAVKASASFLRRHGLYCYAYAASVPMIYFTFTATGVAPMGIIRRDAAGVEYAEKAHVDELAQGLAMMLTIVQRARHEACHIVSPQPSRTSPCAKGWCIARPPDCASRFTERESAREAMMSGQARRYGGADAEATAARLRALAAIAERKRGAGSFASSGPAREYRLAANLCGTPFIIATNILMCSASNHAFRRRMFCRVLEPSRTITPAQMSVLVVDDSSTMRRIVANSLARIGISGIVEAADGREALNKFDPATIDLIITDWLMPSMDGVELARQLREQGHTVPILLMTTRSLREEIISSGKPDPKLHRQAIHSANASRKDRRAVSAFNWRSVRMTAPAWSPDQPLRADATDEQMYKRRIWILRNLPLMNDGQISVKMAWAAVPWPPHSLSIASLVGSTTG